jgi:hypothetical protein
MRSPNWRDIAEAIGVTAIVASLLFVGFQLRQDAEIARASVFASFGATTIEMNQANHQHADLIAKANRGEELSDAEIFILNDMVNNMALNIRFLEIQGQRVGEIVGSTNELNFSAHLFQNPGLRRAWERVDSAAKTYTDPFRSPESLKRTYESGSGAFRDRINAQLSRLDELQQQ